jgi:hypothetical protein
MDKQKPTRRTTSAAPPAKKQDCPDDFRTKPDLDGKNDSGPDPEVHDKDLPPQ